MLVPTSGHRLRRWPDIGTSLGIRICRTWLADCVMFRARQSRRRRLCHVRGLWLLAASLPAEDQTGRAK